MEAAFARHPLWAGCTREDLDAAVEVGPAGSVHYPCMPTGLHAGELTAVYDSAVQSTLKGASSRASKSREATCKHATHPCRAVHTPRAWRST